MALGTLKRQPRFEDPRELLGDRLQGIYLFLADYGDVLFPGDYFADLFKDSSRGRPTVAARIMATVMILQSFEGLSDREACDRLGRDLAWQAAAGVHTGYEPFDPTLLVMMRNRLRTSKRPRRMFEDTKAVARQAGVMKDRARVLDSTPLYDAVTTQDTVTQLRAAIRKLLRLLEGTALAVRIRAALSRDDDYRSPGKPPCDWDDPAAREALVDALVRDAQAALGVVEGEELSGAAADAVELLARVAGQDVEQREDGTFVIVQNVAKDRIISTVDPEARHGHKSRNRQFDGFKTHVSIDPDSELIDEVAATAGNVSDRDAVDELLAPVAEWEDKPEVYGDCAYADGDTLNELEGKGFEVRAKVPPASNKKGRFSKDQFIIDFADETVICPAGQVAEIDFDENGGGVARFGKICATCPLASQCTTNKGGRNITIHPYEELLQAHKAEQQDPDWQRAYKDNRPKVERKIGHMTRRQWGGRKARTRGLRRIITDVLTRAAATNLSRLHVLGVRWDGAAWAAGP